MATEVLRQVEKQSGMGAIPHEQGVVFRVWAPNADSVSVVGDFNDWSPDADPLEREDNGYWYADVAEAGVEDEYRYLIKNGEIAISRIDPYAREVTNSIGNAVVHDPRFEWEGDDFRMPPVAELVIYELHIGTFNGSRDDMPAGFERTIERLEHLARLGVNAIELMPTAEFAGDFSWGYNPAHIFAVESAYGGPWGLKELVKQAHRHGLAVILDVVYNHFGPSDLDLWQFDGWREGDYGGIYFYNDWRAETPWGKTRPDYGRPEVRQFIRDNAMMWLEEYHMDGLRYDMTLYMRTVRGGGDDLPDGWRLAQEINRELHERFPGRIAIAEDLQNNEWLTKSIGEGGAGFDAQWDAQFVHPVRSALALPDDADRSMGSVRDAIVAGYNNEPFQRVVYTESHDEVANGKSRVPSEVSPHDEQGLNAQRRSALGAALVFTSPGIPMLFQGQEFLQDGWFRDDEPLDWSLSEKLGGITRLYHDLIQLRLNRAGNTRGLCGGGVDVYHVDESNKVVAFHRWDAGGPGDDVVVVLNFSNQALQKYKVQFPRGGEWRLRMNTDARVYSEQFGDNPQGDVEAAEDEKHEGRYAAALRLSPYSALVFSQDAE